MAGFFLAQLASSAVTFLVFVILTRQLGPEGFGLYNVTVLTGTVAFAFLFGWLSAAISRFHFAPDFGSRAVPGAMVIGLITAVALVPVVAIAAAVAPDGVATLILLAALFCVCHSASELAVATLRVYRDLRSFVIVIIGRPTVGLLAALAMIWLGFGYIGAIIGMSVGPLVLSTVAFVRILPRSGVIRPDLLLARQFYVYGAPLAVVGASTMLIGLTTQGLLAKFGTLEAVGLFAAAQTLATRAINMPMTVLLRVSSPDVYEAFEKGGPDGAQPALDRHVSFLMLISLPVVCLLALANDTLARLLFTPEFRGPVAAQLPILALAAFVTGVQGAIYSFAFTISRQTLLQLGVVAVVTVAHIGIAAALILSFGSMGAAVSVLLTACLGLLAFALAGSRSYPIRLPVEDLRKSAIAAFCPAPIAIYADGLNDVVATALLLALAFAVFVALLVAQRQLAMMQVINGVRRRLRRRPAQG
ncbi:MAG: hypothetical protein AAGE76_14620 [Pseudomonadota bacterium]